MNKQDKNIHENVFWCQHNKCKYVLNNSNKDWKCRFLGFTPTCRILQGGAQECSWTTSGSDSQAL